MALRLLSSRSATRLAVVSGAIAKEIDGMRVISECQEIVADENSSQRVESGLTERRKEPRYHAGGAVTFRLVLRESEYHCGELRNVSRSGLNLRSSRNLPVGELVEVRLDGGTILGDVRYCRQTGAVEFETGIWIAAAKWLAEQVPAAVVEQAPEARAA
jgi:hypothetical protein